MSITITLNKDTIQVNESEKLHLHHYLFLVFILTKPFYLQSSGTIQISDLIFALSLFTWVIHKHGVIGLTNNNQYLALFTLGVIIVNSVYSLINMNSIVKYGTSDNFLVNNMYYVYNFFVVLLFSDSVHNNSFLKALLHVSIFNASLQAIVFFLGKGRSVDGVRYMGSFNDPNQFSFFLLTSFFIVYILASYFKDQSKNRNKATVILMFILVFFLLFQGSSTGMFLGIATFAFFLVISYANSERSAIFSSVKILTFLVVACITIYVLINGMNTLFSSSDNYFVQRIGTKVEKAMSGGLNALIKERGIDKVFAHPEYLLFGAGEGFYDRFASTSPFEIHSTPFAILFCYGIIPFLFLLKWLRGNLKNLPTYVLPVYLGLLVESFTLANQRQPMLWMIIVLAGLKYTNPAEKRTYRIVRRI